LFEVPVKCDKYNFSNGMIVFEKGVTKIGSTVHHECFPSHKLVGNGTRTCLDSGIWTGSTPKCVGKSCDKLAKYNKILLKYLAFIAV